MALPGPGGNYNFDASGLPKLRHSPGETTMLKNEHREEIPIKAKNNIRTRKNLGHYKSPKGTCVTNSGYVKKKVAVERADTIEKCGNKSRDTNVCTISMETSSRIQLTSIFLIRKTTQVNRNS